MKNIFKVFIITAGIVVSFHVNSFALVDASIMGGGIFSGSVEADDDSSPKGWGYGAKVHYNMGVPFFELGIGGYYQSSKIKFDILDSTSDETKLTYGLDANVILSVPLIPLNPYIRGTYAIMDKYADDTKYFKAYGVGAGIEVVIFPLPSIRLFAEYMYDYTDHDDYMTTNSANFGVKVSI